MGRLAYYEEHKGEFDLLWIGDSRTLCGMHPERLDPLLGTRSLNLAVWAHWFPTQYPFIRDLIEKIRPGTRVVWSIGHQNFQPANATLSKNYPIPLSDVPLYLSLGFSWDSLRPNLLKHSALGKPLRPIQGTASQLRARSDAFGLRTFYPRPKVAAVTSASGEGEADRLAAELRRDPHNLHVQVIYSSGRPTSVAVNRYLGGYVRYEIDPAFFRAQQDKARQASLGAPPAKEFLADSARWELFTRILSLCAKRGLKLVVNEIEEAPHSYSQLGSKEARRKFMRERVQAEVEKRGFTYVRPDYDRLSDEHYFDYNHLNRRGVDAYAPLLAEVLRPVLDATGH